MTDNQLIFSLHGVSCQLTANHAPFLRYARAYLDGIGETEKPAPVVDVVLHWDVAPTRNWAAAGVQRRGRRLLQRDNEILQTEILSLPGLQLASMWEDERLRVEAWYRPGSRLEKAAHRLGRDVPKLFVTLIYFLVYFPLIFWLETYRGWHLTHAGAVSLGERTWILAGLPGGGKSTFSLAMLANPMAKLLSDNLLLFSDGAVFACPEPLHLSEASRRLLPDATLARLSDAGREFSYQRRDFVLPPSARAMTGKPEKLLFLGLGERLKIEPISTRTAFNRLICFDFMAKEMMAYQQFATALDVVSPNPHRLEAHHQALEKLLTTIDCAEIWLPAGQNLADVMPEILSEGRF